MSIRMHIERLVLHGVELNPADRIRLERDLTVELGRLFHAADSDRSMEQSTAVPTIAAPAIVVGSTGASIGCQLARSVFGALGKSGSVPQSEDMSPRGMR